MRTPTAALAWEIGRRHRWGLVGVAAYVVALAAVRLVLDATGQTLSIEHEVRFAIVVLVPLTVTSLYVLAVFSFGLHGDLAARQSTYPARLFALPVTTTTLVGWPMLIGALVLAVLWIATRQLVLWPANVRIPTMWPALLAAVLLAWTQALTWMPYGLPGLRVVVTMLWLTMVDGVVLLAIHRQASEAAMFVMLAPHLPLAFVAARIAVTRARQGEVPDWRGAFAGVLRLARPRARTAPFASASEALAWYEWRRHGWTLPALLALVLPFELGMLFLLGDTPLLVFVTLLGVVLTPPIMAGFAAADVRRAESAPRGAGLPTFLATRPANTVRLVGAKLGMTLRSALLAWLLLLPATALGVSAAGLRPMMRAWWEHLVDWMGRPRAIIVSLLVLAVLLLSTWRQLVQSLYVGLSGRVWLARVSVFVAVTMISTVGPLALWFLESGDAQLFLWNWIRELLAALAILKTAAAAWIATRLHRQRLLGDRALVGAAALWTALVLALYALLAWMLPTPFFPRHVFLLLAILVIPLVRISMAPLALDVGRHR